MPIESRFNINESKLEEVLRVKRNMLEKPKIEKPIGFKTVKPKEEIDMHSWFNHIKNSLRMKDLFGNLDIK